MPIDIFQNPDDDKALENKKKSGIFASFKDKLTKSGKYKWSFILSFNTATLTLTASYIILGFL